ncbi:putative transferase CAF17 homolog, mitochondrial [Neodiprion pinetum]|uniref:putative transferase CAF17 homolog, mitochondrial n=1 Tax=Neodiprion pinetum TaxID=441929 RepID=UPI001EDE1B08|nr:putative transferase CAF17 homolog, mitochondrial [Neodiprion pinetum]
MFKLRPSRLRLAANMTRSNSTNPTSKVIEHLSKRSLLRVSGTESSSFLQGLITNDMRHLDEGKASMYTMFLNTKGRVMFDAILYRTHEIGVYLLECDSRALMSVQKHLKLYRVRRKIDIDDLSNEMKVWALFDPDKASIESWNAGANITKKIKLEGQIFPCDSLVDIVDTSSSKVIENIRIYPDPRFSGLGFRILSDLGTQTGDIVARIDPDTVESKEVSTGYRSLIYKLGIGEGCDDLPPGKALPLESNCDYLHGVSFHKGCYIGQELTARTYHTGVVRKRLMPITLESSPPEPIQYDQSITDESEKSIGKLRGHVNENGLGLVRIAEALTAQSLRISGLKGKALKPVWWPQEAPKESASIGKSD